MSGHFLKQPVGRCEAYLAWVRTLPCRCCNRWPTADRANEAHHRIGHGRCSTTKVSDFEVMPLCLECHANLHRMGWDAWEKSYDIDQRAACLETLFKSLDADLFTFNKKKALTYAFG